MKFIHCADCHIGSWKDEKLGTLSTDAFIKAMDISIAEQVDFILIAGDIFNTALPAIEKLKIVTKKLREVKEKNIPIYSIPGSHDFSPSGKTILDVLEHAGLLINVVKGTVVNNKLQLKWTIDKTGAKITGMMGKKGSLEKKYYETLDLESIEQESGFKIFMFHSSIAELKPEGLEKMEASPISFLPKNCDYYAGGHVHIVKHTSLEGYKNIVYPGPLFPNSFSELEKLNIGGMYMYNEGVISYIPLNIRPVISLTINANHESATQITTRMKEQIITINPINAIITIRICGELSEGRTSDLDFKSIKEILEEKGAWFILKSTSMLTSKEFEEITIRGENTIDIEEKIIQEHTGKFQSIEISKEIQEQWTKKFLHTLNTEKLDGEKINDFENRLRKDVNEILKM
ncbi:MAG: DNA repair exonuclease [Candidatus Woesearchaeota archaeon]|jgi:hypothetical protein